MADNNGSLFNRLTKLFRSGPIVKRRVKNFKEPTASTAVELFKRAHNDIYNNTLSAYGSADRMSRYADFSSMEATPEICSTLDIFAEETVSPDEHGRVLHIYSENRKVQETLDHLFYDILNVEFNLVMWVRNLPIHKDTLIPLLNGQNITIEDLSTKIKAGKEIWVYSTQVGTNKLVPGKVEWCDLTRETTQMVRVWLDDESYIDTTPDHEFIMRDGSSKRAEDLCTNDSLMPFYRKVSSSKKSNSLDGYEKAYDPKTNKFVYTHRIVAEIIDGNIALTDRNKHLVTHHQDFNKRNNDPGNLQKMGDRDHWLLHANHCKEILHTPENTQKRMQGIDRWLRSDRHKNLAKKQLKVLQEKGLMRKSWDEYNNSEMHTAHNKIRSRDKIAMWQDSTRRLSATANMKIKFDKKCTDIILQHHKDAKKYISFKKLGPILKKDITLIKHIKTLNPTSKRDFSKSISSAPGIKRIFNEALHKNYFDVIEEELPKIATTPWFQRSKSKSQNPKSADRALKMRLSASSKNHKVSRIEWLSEKSNAYCMEVLGPNGEHDRHNFMVLGSGTNDINSGVCLANCKYGDFFLFNDINPEFGVTAAYPIPIAEMEREEGFDPEDPLAARFRWITQGNQVLENWQVAHFRLLGNDAFLPYGSSVLEAARRIWRQLILIEDAMLVYRVIRAPERRVFYIDVGNVPPEDVANYLEQATTALKRNQVINKDTGQVDLRYNPLSVDEDYFLPVRGGESGTKIETLAGGTNTSAIEDVEYIQNKLFAALKVPKAYLGFDESIGCFTGDTLVSLTNGSSIAIAEMAQTFTKNPQSKYEVYAYDLENKRVVAGKVKAAWKTKEVSEIYKITLDNGSVIKCTNNHPIMLRDGQYKRADQLSKNDSIMPLRERKSSKSTGDYLEGYSQHWCIDRNKWVYAHREVGREKFKNLHRNNVIHHVNFKKEDNSSDNLELLQSRFSSDKSTQSIYKEYYIDKCSYSAFTSNIKSTFGSIRQLREYAKNYNHKVASIEIIKSSLPVKVYDLEVEKYHNFAINCHANDLGGIFVHNSKATLAQEDIRFSRTIQRIQKTIISELNKIAMVHLYCHGYDGEELANFDLRLSNPSTIAQQQKLELVRTRFEIAGTVPEGAVHRAWVQKNVLGLTDEEIEEVQEGRIKDKKNDVEVENTGTGESSDGGGDMGGDDSGGGEDLFAGDKPTGDELLTALPADPDSDADDDEDVDDNLLHLSIDDEDAPIKAQNKIMNAFGEPVNKRRVVRDGPLATHTPDFNKMVSVGKRARGQDSMNKPFGDDLKNPFGEAVENLSTGLAPRLTFDLVKTLDKMSSKININRTDLLFEAEELDNEE